MTNGKTKGRSEEMTKANTVVRRINYLHVTVRTNGGAPRMFQAKAGEATKRYLCECPKGSQGCSHVTALYTFLHNEAADMVTAAQATPAHA